MNEVAARRGPGRLRGACAACCLGLLTTALQCSEPKLTSPAYFVLLPLLRSGLGRPSAPTGLSATYEAIPERISLSWQPSQDPEGSGPVLVYHVYFFVNGPPPADIYQPRYFLDEAVGFGYSISSDPFTGDLYFVVTAFDGAAESLPSNMARLNLTSAGTVQP